MGVFRSDGPIFIWMLLTANFIFRCIFFDASKVNSFAEDNNETIKTLGIFNVGVFDGNGKMTAMRTMNLPTMITINVYDSETRDVTLSDGKTQPCKVIKYLKGAKVMSSAIFQEEEYAKAYLKYITGGNLPSVIPYSQLLLMWRKNMALNGVLFRCPFLLSGTGSRNNEP